MSIRRASVLSGISLVLAAIAAGPSVAAVPHTVQPGETLWSIAAQNNLTTRTVAAYNGIPEDAQVVTGQTVDVPTAAEGAGALASAGSSAAPAPAASGGSGADHTVAPGESLSSIAAANGISTEALAADNGLASDAQLLAGETIDVPGATSSTTSTAVETTATTGATGTSPLPPAPQANPYWTSPIPCPSCPSGEAYLASNAAANWNDMRQASLRIYGIDLYPAGPYSAYRSYAQQLYLYDLYRSGQGNLAAVPGTSSHEYGTALDLADPAMRTVVDQIGAQYGWVKSEAESEWWHVNYVGP